MGYTLGLVALSDGFSLCFFFKCDVETKITTWSNTQ